MIKKLIVVDNVQYDNKKLNETIQGLTRVINSMVDKMNAQDKIIIDLFDGIKGNQDLINKLVDKLIEAGYFKEGKKNGNNKNKKE
jgi:methyltransferase-like protein